MPTWLKVLLAVVGLVVVLVIALVVVGVYAVRRYGPEFIEASRRNMEEGQEYGRRTDNEGCLNEAAARYARVEGFADKVRTGMFMEVCLKTSRPTPGFCDGVPRQTDFLKSITWQQQQCKRFGLKPEQQCGQLFQGVQRFCHERERHGGANTGEGEYDPPPPPPAPEPTPAPRRPAAPAR